MGPLLLITQDERLIAAMRAVAADAGTVVGVVYDTKMTKEIRRAVDAVRVVFVGADVAASFAREITGKDYVIVVVHEPVTKLPFEQAQAGGFDYVAALPTSHRWLVDLLTGRHALAGA